MCKDITKLRLLCSKHLQCIFVDREFKKGTGEIKVPPSIDYSETLFQTLKSI